MFVMKGTTVYAVTGVAPTLGASAAYSALGKAGVTNTGLSVLSGRVGSDSSNVGFADTAGPGIAAGYDVAPTVNTPEADALTAYGQLAAQGPGPAQTLSGNVTITPGVYDVAAGVMTGGTITLDGAGVYIFSSTSSITDSGGTTVAVTNGASACDVYWQVPIAMNIGTGSQIKGTIITNSGDITLATGASLIGRALALVGEVTLQTNAISDSCSSGTPPAGPGGPVPVPPLIDVLKVPSPLSLPSGPGLVTYTYSVRNIGTVPMSTVRVTDDSCGPVNFVSGDTNANGALDLTEVWIYNCATTLAATHTNTVTATGFSLGLSSTDTATATVVVGAAVVPPLIHVVKIPYPFTLPAGGGAVTYRYTVTNPGTVALSDVTVTDNKCTGLPGRVVGHPGDINQNNLLEPTESWSFTCISNLTATTLNTATASGTANGITATDLAFATVVVAPPALPATEVPAFPSTGLSADHSTPWKIIFPVGIIGALFLLYIYRRKFDRKRIRAGK
ncbi:MAG: ice-binding family protein [Candidatus Doudnabacteria bacterium]